MIRGLLPKLGALLAAALSFNLWAQSVTVVEYYNRTLDSYFITGRANEQALLDGIADFQRTGMTFQATATASAGASLTKICRFYISVASPYTSTHFYGREGIDCESIRGQNVPGFSWEDYDFATQQPSSGTCPGGTTTVYRGFRAAAGGKTSNHRYSTTLTDYNAAIAAGYVGEQAAFCASSATAVSVTTTPPPAGSGDCGTFYYSGKQISYQSTVTSSAFSGTVNSSLTRTYDPTPVTFNGQSAVRVVNTSPTDSPTYDYFVDGASTWSSLGGRSTSNGVTQDTYYVPPIVYSKSFAVGQSINLNQSVNFNPPLPFGNATLTGTIELTARESVTVPAGSFANACKFTINQTTTYTSIGASANTRTVTWIVPGIGTVRTEIVNTGAGMTTSTTQVATAVQ